MHVYGTEIPRDVICNILKETNLPKSLKGVNKDILNLFWQAFFQKCESSPGLRDRAERIQKKYPKLPYEKKVKAVFNDLKYDIKAYQAHRAGGAYTSEQVEQQTMSKVVPSSMPHFVILEQWLEDVNLIHFFKAIASQVAHAGLYLRSIESEENSEKATDTGDKADRMRTWLFSYGSDLISIKKFDCSNDNISKLPKEIGLCAGLENLMLRNNNLKKLPAEIGQLTQLKCLDLMDNDLSSLPVEIGQLTQLEDLRIEGNPLITSLPVEMDALTNLKTLYIHPNQLKMLPPNMKKRIASGEISVSMLHGMTYAKQGLLNDSFE